MPRGVYDRKKKKSTEEGASAAPVKTGAAKTKRAWKAKAPKARTSVAPLLLAGIGLSCFRVEPAVALPAPGAGGGRDSAAKIVPDG